MGVSLSQGADMLIEGLAEHVAQLFGPAACAFDDYNFMANRALARSRRSHLEFGD